MSGKSYKPGDQFIVYLNRIEFEADGTEHYVISNSIADDGVSDIADLSKLEMDRLCRVTGAEINTAFEDGLNFAQDVYKKLEGLSSFEVKEIFGDLVHGGSLWAIIRKYPVKQIRDMIDQFDFKCEVGDEFIISYDGSEEAAIVSSVDMDKESYCLITRSGLTICLSGRKAFIRCIKRRTGDKYDITFKLRSGDDDK